MKILCLQFFFEEKLVYFHQYPLDASFYQFVGPSKSKHIIINQKGRQMLNIISQNQTFIFLLPF
jgi:hypothetical protein